jgi:peptide deformylase
MLSLMRISGGVGLAATQAGLDLSLLVVEIEGRIFKLVNPVITKSEGSITFLEGCLSFPGLELEVRRANKVWIKTLDEEGRSLEITAEGFLAVVFQHEIDHVEGVVFIDRISFWQRLKAHNRLRKIIRKTKDEVRKQREKQ